MEMERRGLGWAVVIASSRLNHQIIIFIGFTVDGIVHMCHIEISGSPAFETELFDKWENSVMFSHQLHHTNIAKIS